MPHVVICFSDGEVLHAETPELSFDLPIVEAEVRSVDANTEMALLPLASIRQIIVGEVEAAPAAEELLLWDRAAFHFVDGQVLRASVAPTAMLGAHGGVWRVVEPGSDELRTLAIPYAALKGIFRVRQWDSRPLSERMRADDPNARLDQLARILSEREEHSLDLENPPPPPRPLMRRMRRSALDRSRKTDD